MMYIKRFVICLLGGILGFLILGWGYNIFIGRPITLNHYFSKHNVSYMKIFLTDNEGNSLNGKELTQDEIDDYLKKFGDYKIFKPFFRRTFIAKQDNNHIDLHISNEANNFDVVFPLTDQGGINLIRYTFYPYKVKHKDMYNYLLDLLKSNYLGEYEFDKIIYHSPLSSYTPEYIVNQMKYLKCTIENAVFEISSSDFDYKVSHPVYKKEKIEGNSIQILGDNNTISIFDYKDKFRYSIYDADNNKINYYLYLLDSELWIAAYTNNNDNDTDIIMYIYKLKSL